MPALGTWGKQGCKSRCPSAARHPCAPPRALSSLCKSCCLQGFVGDVTDAQQRLALKQQVRHPLQLQQQLATG